MMIRLRHTAPIEMQRGITMLNTKKAFSTSSAIAALAVVALLSACSGVPTDDQQAPSGDEVTIDVGTTTLSFPEGTEPVVAVFAGSGIAYQTAYQEAFEELKVEHGIEITYFDSQFDPTTQLNQIRSAIQSGTYNAFIIENYAAEAACSLLTEDAPAANIVVSQISNPTCDEGTKPAGDEFWSPGTLNTVGAHSTVTYADSLVRLSLDFIESDSPEVAVINGPPLVAATQNMDTALDNNGLTPVANLNSDYTTATALQQTASILQATPDVDAIYSVGPNLTVGIVSALKQAGKAPGDVKVFEIGATEANAALVEEGYLTMTVPYTPRSVANTAVEQIIAAFAGNQGDRFYPALNQGTATEPFAITRETTGSYSYEY